MKLDNRIFQNIANRYRDSRVARFVILLALLFIISAVSIYFLEARTNADFSSLLDGFWWMIITFSTTGYGDIVPITLGGRILAVAVILSGIAGAGLLSATITSWLVDHNSRSRRGLLDYQHMRSHLIVCGWKQDMQDILSDILRASKDLRSDQIVLVNNADPQHVDELKESDQLKGLKFVRGDYYDEHILKRANVKQAFKVLVLADSLESTAASEVDSKTVMTVLTCKAMSKETYVAAEVLDRKFESYLRHAQCDEIIFSRVFSRQLLAASSSISGMSHIMHELINQDNSGTRLCTYEVPENLVGRSYAELIQYILKASAGDHDNVVVLGLLQNTGTQTRMKLEALREAQKTSDVSKLVVNIKGVKGLEANKPVFLPPDTYIIPRYSSAIVLERLLEPETSI